MSKQSKLPASDPTAATSSILEQSELPTDDRDNQTATIVPVLDQVTELSESTFQPRPIKIFPEMSLAVRVKRKNKEWLVSGIADWAMGYGDRATLEDGAVLLAIEAKRTEKLSSAEAQLLTYLATIRQLRIQADKKNVMTQGFYSDGENYRFMCIRNDGTVMKSQSYDISLGDDSSCLKLVLNFLLGMVTTAAGSSLNTSPIKPGPERDEKIDNFDRDVFVEVFEDPKVDDVPIPTIYHDYIEKEDEWSDIIRSLAGRIGILALRAAIVTMKMGGRKWWQKEMRKKAHGSATARRKKIEREVKLVGIWMRLIILLFLLELKSNPFSIDDALYRIIPGYIENENLSRRWDFSKKKKKN